ncbi:MAG: NAD(P)H-dependent oxidoreductase [Mesorhizobium sp.]|jgi:NAD(P)H-dependent FMN reductase|uniref:NAD(P)H-dependent oxidoreductase n=4 Tax=Mesorhizobium TaxID=68287 RepID=A0A271KHP9_9HYPH|nr:MULTISPECIES: NADPH-dependent FMN reductase [Mesorhizobium]PAP95318.1 NAD(P)H-dependent oxidoreductase [Mesorhizobium wenxiniae]QIA22301.1 NAD(P)H-dependent oxidoreductase [Mesorhizobium sp. AA22]RUV51211.1 NAD(P)H-dependent oxidoreductase [Mesorhizobium sp. M5C.F.Ca.IN.020.29.1.1]RUV68832.1 NAD(P)H-dependent oxidoreductase [Mesorhizobium sp. M5C.F.Cr.IN.023.01.1.1]RWB30021.1 MAG: NAD(P)H-dependent oxidoreductase [Mesorhizobium sp.]
MSKPKIAIVVGSTRAARFADVPTQWIAKIAKSHADIDVEVVDLRDFPLPFFDEVASSAWAPSQNEVAKRWQKKVAEFDGFIFTAAEYNHGPTAVLKNAIDYAANEWNKKPAGFVGYGSVGGARAVEQLRLHAVELQMAPVKSAVHIAWADFLAVRQGEKKLDELEHLNQAATALVNDVAWWAKVLKAARQADAVAEEVKAA